MTVTAAPSQLVRAHRTAVRVPGAAAPFDTLHVTLRHPALPAASDVERMSGMLRADPTGAPYPVVVVLPGVNVSSTGYLDLAVALAQAGMVAVTFDWVGELFAGQHGLTPGVDLAVVGPETYGTAPTTPVLAPLLEALASCNAEGPLAGLLDLDRVGLFGHSAGGTVALQSARAEWFPQVRAVATYGAHTMASQQLGHPAGTLLPAPVSVPVMLVAGTADGVVAASAIRYGEEAGAPAHDPVERTFVEALPADTEAWLVRLAGAGHMLPAAPEDPTSARGFLEEPLTADAEHLRGVLVELLVAFYSSRLGTDAVATTVLAGLADDPRPEIADIRRR
ncbi:dienelactone hydrolase family protein [Nocardioides sp. zg-536]|uniref:Dienelactone hydrolase family protein n=1 Tax=Nocardioides faecalis TaxID=2803858 RepID=A0A938Y808_9ACTN|nr:dienelactone hydrolase family protein [Nocardioides faecalis]MBM9459186.1 dienelactone hydrolase family protein [Nocardioides faecalis]MBS4751434.1 dienelactone hydrolase family protein [Nocardioides faecalis]QVI59674.1 dienelactone hydrolase family protein [Nocardioides faecalis]